VRALLLATFIGLSLPTAAAARAPLAAAKQTNKQAAAGRTITLPLKVCVSDAAGARVAVQPLLLNSTANKPDAIKQRTADDCYASDPIKLAVGQTYFVAVLAQGQTAFTPFTVAAGEKEKTLDLALAGQGGRASADIEICANDAGGGALTVTEIEATGDQTRLTRKEAVDPNCYRVEAAAANEFKLSLTARGAGTPPAPSYDRLILLCALLLLGATALTLAVLLFVRQRGPAARADQTSAGEVTLALKELTGEVLDTRRGVEALGKRLSSLSTAARQTDADQADGASAVAAHVPATDAPPLGRAPHAPAPHAPAAAPASRHNRDSDDAKLKYRELSEGLSVEHFYLMPSGSSTASGMVEDSRVELLEQGNGTYVGFRSSVNEGEAMVFPMPNVHFSPDTFKALFPGLTVQDYESRNIEPRLAVNTQHKVWKVQ
jgi:hypothetical protein